jgi:uncharacterized membrane protein
MGIQGFIYEYLIEPLYYDAFNPVNIFVYAVLFLLLLFLILRVFDRYDVSLDSKFYSYFIGFVFLGAFLGALKDVRFHGSPFLSTPGIYLGLSFLLLGGVIFGKLFEKRVGFSYSLIPAVTVYSITAFLILQYLPRGVDLSPIVYILSLGIILSVIVFFFLRKIGVGLLEGGVNFGIFLAQMLDASSTYLGVTLYGFGEKFFIMGYLIESISPAALFPVKAALILLVLYYLENEKELRRRNKDLIKAALILLGLAPALRNTFLSVLL